MKLLILLTLAAIVAITPFVLLKRPWALSLWRRTRLLAVIYALVILISAVVALIFRWNEIYG